MRELLLQAAALGTPKEYCQHAGCQAEQYACFPANCVLQQRALTLAVGNADQQVVAVARLGKRVHARVAVAHRRGVEDQRAHGVLAAAVATAT